ncbi:hypothetical protein C8R43DRAFT_1141901 [Mycena crocata]|nr:hypothetical protein C8R43DRAFT_1141901 [Mycena crocata]
MLSISYQVIINPTPTRFRNSIRTCNIADIADVPLHVIGIQTQQASTTPLKGYLPQQYSSTSPWPAACSAAQKILFDFWKSRKQGYGVSKGSINLRVGGTQHHSKPDSIFLEFL